jgi:hypothetical protein
LKLKQYNNRFSPTISCCIIYIGVRDRGQEGNSPPPKKIFKNWKTMEIWANARENEENLGKYITKYIEFWSFHSNI